MLKYLQSSVAAAVLVGGCMSSAALAQSSAETAMRISRIEDQMRVLVGQIEELSFEMKQLKSQLGNAKSGALETAPAAKPKALALEEAPAEGEISSGELASAQVTEQGIEQIQGGGLAAPEEQQSYTKTIINEDGTESQVIVRKAPGPKVLGALDGSAAADDGGFQGQVLVAPAQQEPGADAGLIQQGAEDGGSDSIETVSLAPDSPESLYERSNESLLRRQFSEAEAGFSTFIEKYPEHGLAGSAQYWLGETYYAQGDYRQAAQAFLVGYKQYPKSRRAADSLLKLGISLGRLGQKQQACAAFDAVSSDYPKAVEARKRAQAEAKRADCAS